MVKEDLIKIRIEKFKKEDWKKFCLDKNISLTSLIVNSVEGKILENDRRQIIAFIEKQDNLFVKIETNINQVAKIVNGQKFIGEIELKNFSNQLSEIAIIKIKQNEMFEKLYSMLTK